MRAIEIARQFAEHGAAQDACTAYTLAIHENNGQDPAEDMEAALYILQYGGDYKVSYTCFQRLYSQGHFRDDCLSIMTAAFYEPNVKDLRGRYERNCKLLRKYPYLFRKDFPSFDKLPVRFFPFDDKSYIPFDTRQESFGDYINFKHPVISRNFFKDLENPILASDVFSQYELEYLNDNVRKSEYVARENHIYLHYSDWGTFCSYLQCLNMRPLLKEEKVVFLIGDEISQYPIDFAARFGIDYSKYSLKPVGIREVNRLIWHTQLSTHNGGDLFNEIFDSHPNLMALPSVFFSEIEKSVTSIRTAMETVGSRNKALELAKDVDPRLMEELYLLRNRTDKDVLVLLFANAKEFNKSLDPASRIAPALFFQPHFSNMVYDLHIDPKNRTTLDSQQYETVRSSSLFRGFKYIKTFTPMRRMTTSHGATVKFMYGSTQVEPKEDEAKKIVPDAVCQRVLNRSFMIDWQDRLFQDSVLVRFEDAKLNPKAVFTALAAFLDLPYTQSMTYCSEKGEVDPESMAGNVRGFNPDTVYRTYDDYVNNSERIFIEYFLRDAYEYYGYDFHYYDGGELDIEQIKELIKDFGTVDKYIRDSWRRNVYSQMRVTKGEVAPEVLEEAKEQALEKHMKAFEKNRVRNAELLMRGLYFINKNGQPLHMMPKLELDPALLEQPLYH